MHQRRAVGIFRLVKNARDFESIRAFVNRLLGHDHRQSRERGRIRKRQLFDAPRGHVNAMDVGRDERIFNLDVDVRAVWTPLRTRVDSAPDFNFLGLS